MSLMASALGNPSVRKPTCFLCFHYPESGIPNTKRKTIGCGRKIKCKKVKPLAPPIFSVANRSFREWEYIRGACPSSSSFEKRSPGKRAQPVTFFRESFQRARAKRRKQSETPHTHSSDLA
ncbi:hypothetical protein AVEN_48599-1 [Araneus ventricosus]|uniref:Uncharacterized protein n=1 Tax=Araneus ventricosus TaxID=182803 RepID=A0A4Y2N289_ARAVE|nr:hypothetical protein AVEN_48599-1 [Araneus ventricosus]